MARIIKPGRPESVTTCHNCKSSIGYYPPELEYRFVGYEEVKSVIKCLCCGDWITVEEKVSV